MTATKLDPFLDIAVCIYDLTVIRKERVWLTKLISHLAVVSPHYTKMQVWCILDTLSDCGVINHKVGETENGRCGVLMDVDESHLEQLDILYHLVNPIQE